MNFSSLGKISRSVSVLFVLTLAGMEISSGTTASAAEAFTLSGHTAPFTSTAGDLGAVDSSTPVTLRFWLKLHNGDKLASKIQDLYDSSSASYHQWLTDKEIRANYLPTVQELAQVQKYAQAQGFTSVTIDASGLFVTATGTAAGAQKAFQVNLHNFSLGEKSVMANTSDPVISDPAGQLVARVGGLSTQVVHNTHVLAEAAEGAGHPMRVPLFASEVTSRLATGEASSSGVVGTTFETVCFRDAQTVNFVSAAGALPKATYTGNRYGAEVTSVAPSLPPCGYGAAEIQAAYGIDKLVKKGLDGRGQNIVIVDAYGSPTIQADAAAHAARYGLPAPQLTVLQPAGVPVTGAWNADQQDWTGETSLDVEWAHVMAPGASIKLIEAMSDSEDDLVAGIAYAVENNLGNVISNSWSGFESQEDPATIAIYTAIFQVAVAKGISIHFSSGDWGDLVGKLGYSDVLFPSSSPYVTSVGGTSLALNADKTIKFQTGWGNNRMRVAQGVATPALSAAVNNVPFDPTVNPGFYAGAGGGTSRLYAKPVFQKKLTGTMRMQPDIAYLADPFTGVEIVTPSFDGNGNPTTSSLTVIGGTSLACPMFTGMWAVAEQAAGKSLGQASAMLYDLPAGAITDIQAVTSTTNVTGAITDGTGVNPETELMLGYPETAAPFYSALYDNPFDPYYWYVMTFGTDSTLMTGPGWDDVTGLGTPNGVKFVADVVKAARSH